MAAQHIKALSLKTNPGGTYSVTGYEADGNMEPLRFKKFSVTMEMEMFFATLNRVVLHGNAYTVDGVRHVKQ